MAAYLVGHITVHDTDAWQDYLSRVGATLAAGGGELVFRGQLGDVLWGAPPGQLIVVARFADRAAVRRWHDGPDYQALIPLRQRAASVVLSTYAD